MQNYARTRWPGKATLLTLLLLGVAACGLRAETYRVLAYTPANPPYNIDNGKQMSGIFIDLFAAIGAITGDRFEFHRLPISRGLKAFEQGRIDIEPGIAPVWRQHMAVAGLYSVPFGSSREVMVFAPGKKFPVRAPEDLLGKEVGIVRGFHYPLFDEVLRQGRITLWDNQSEWLLLKQLSLGRIDQVVVSQAAIEYFQKIHPEWAALEIGDVIMSNAVSMRVHPSKRALLTRLNLAIEQLLANGEMQRIYDKYR